MFTVPEHFSAASKAGLEAQLALFAALSNTAFESMEKVVDLHINVARASLEESNAAAKQFLTAKDAQQWLALSAAQNQPNAEKALAYGRHLTAIASGAHAALSKAAEAQLAGASRTALELIEEAAKHAPAGAESAIALAKSAIGNASTGYEQLSKTARQVMETLGANIPPAAGSFAPAAAGTTRAGAVKK